MRKVYTIDNHIDGLFNLVCRDRRLDPDARWALTQKLIEFIHLWEDTPKQSVDDSDS